jgi:hypothetical protein
VGFLYASGWWLWKRRRPRYARLFLVFGLVIGLGIGLGGMAAGEHFLSDVLWSALLALGLAHILYYYILQIPQRGASVTARLPGKGMMIVLLVLAMIARIPHDERLTNPRTASCAIELPDRTEVMDHRSPCPSDHSRTPSE